MNSIKRAIASVLSASLLLTGDIGDAAQQPSVTTCLPIYASLVSNQALNLPVVVSVREEGNEVAARLSSDLGRSVPRKMSWRNLILTPVILAASACAFYNPKADPAIHSIAGENRMTEYAAHQAIIAGLEEAPADSAAATISSPDELPGRLITHNRILRARRISDRRSLNIAFARAAVDYTWFVGASATSASANTSAPYFGRTSIYDGSTANITLLGFLGLDPWEYAQTPTRPSRFQEIPRQLANALISLAEGTTFTGSHRLKANADSVGALLASTHQEQAASRDLHVNLVRRADSLVTTLDSLDFEIASVASAIRFREAMAQRMGLVDTTLTPLKLRSADLFGRRQDASAQLANMLTWNKTATRQTAIPAMAPIRPLSRSELESVAAAMGRTGGPTLVPAANLVSALQSRYPGAVLSDPLTEEGRIAFWNAALPAAAPARSASSGPLIVSPGLFRDLPDSALAISPEEVRLRFAQEVLTFDASALREGTFSMWQGAVGGVLTTLGRVGTLTISPSFTYQKPNDRSRTRIKITSDSLEIKELEHRIAAARNDAQTGADRARIRYQTGRAKLFIALDAVAVLSRRLEIDAKAGRSINTNAPTLVAAIHQTLLDMAKALQQMRDARREEATYYNGVEGGQDQIIAAYNQSEGQFVQTLVAAKARADSAATVAPAGNPLPQAAPKDSTRKQEVKPLPAPKQDQDEDEDDQPGLLASAAQRLKVPAIVFGLLGFFPKVTYGLTLTKVLAGKAVEATIEKGDTLSDLAVRILRARHSHDFSWESISAVVKDLAAQAHLTNPDIVGIGQTFKLTPDLTGLAAPAPSAVPAVPHWDLFANPFAPADPGIFGRPSPATSVVESVHMFPYGPLLIGAFALVAAMVVAFLLYRRAAKARATGTRTRLLPSMSVRGWAVTAMLVVVTTFSGLRFSWGAAQASRLPPQSAAPVAAAVSATPPAPPADSVIPYVTQFFGRGTVLRVRSRKTVRKDAPVIAWTGISADRLTGLADKNAKWNSVLGGPLIPEEDLAAAAEANAIVERAPIVIQSAMEEGSSALTALQMGDDLDDLLNRLDDVRQLAAYQRSVDSLVSPSPGAARFPTDPEETFLPEIVLAEGKLVGALIRQTAERTSYAGTRFTFIPRPKGELKDSLITEGKVDTLFTTAPGENPTLWQTNPVRVMARQKAALEDLIKGYEQLIPALRESQVYFQEQSGEIEVRIHKYEGLLARAKTRRAALEGQAPYAAATRMRIRTAAIGAAGMILPESVLFGWLSAVPGLSGLGAWKRRRRGTLFVPNVMASA